MKRIHDSFDRQSMMTTLGATLGKIADGHVEIHAPILPSSQQQHGYGHAALTFAIGDSAAGYAALTTMAPDQEVLTAEMKINLLSPAAKGPLRAVGRVIKPGKRLVVVQAEVFDGQTQVALLQGTMVTVGNGTR